MSELKVLLYAKFGSESTSHAHFVAVLLISLWIFLPLYSIDQP